MKHANYEIPGRSTIQEWAEEDRPREKLMLKGRTVLTNAELLAILIGSGTVSETAVDVAKNILASVQHDLNALARQNWRELTKFRGIGTAKAVVLTAALELGRRRSAQEPGRKTRITSSRQAFDVLLPGFQDKSHEEFWILILNRANEVIRPVQVSSGGVSGTVVDARVIFKQAIENLASSVILAHNHPSGNLTPSESDRNITRQLVEAGKLLAVPVLDHIICTDHGYFSFADEGLL